MPTVNHNPPPDTYQAALLELGKILLKDENQTPWMSIRKVSGQCRKHWVKLPRLNYSILYLSDWAKTFSQGVVRSVVTESKSSTRPNPAKARDRQTCTSNSSRYSRMEHTINPSEPYQYEHDRMKPT